MNSASASRSSIARNPGVSLSCSCRINAASVASSRGASGTAQFISTTSGNACSSGFCASESNSTTQQITVVTGLSFVTLSPSDTRGWQTGVALDVSPDVSVGTTSLTGSSQLTAPLAIAPTAVLGPRTVTVTNTDGRAGSLADAIAIVKTPDSDGDCKIDGVDLNRMARAWNSAGGEPDYDSSVDLDGDNYVGPEDLSIFIKYFAHTPPGCP